MRHSNFTEGRDILHAQDLEKASGRVESERRIVKRLLIDGHVHVQACFNEERFLSAAFANLSQTGEGMPTLLLAEMPGVEVFDRWKSGLAPWPATPTKESTSLVLDDRILVIAGRQIVTRENLEVLALCCNAQFEERAAFITTIEQVIAAGALCVLPWGVGKWTGNRAKLIQSVLESSLARLICLGDNGNRLAGSPVPRLLRAGSKRGMKIIAGSDPLPLVSHETRGGSYGTLFEANVGFETPAADLIGALRTMPEGLKTFGNLTGLACFGRSQFAMQRRKLK